ncbi:MAG: SCP2 sterol-binding domain-containing protein [Thermoplasmata archaeon]|jgi:putative sterol carrier protein|nr:SCP2 sterol-binding domain-containing protein [Thermoplasmata archaeon]
MVEQILRETIAKFNRKVDEDPKLAEELRGIRKTVQVEVTDGEWYHFVLENSKVGELAKGAGQAPDVRIIASTDTLRKLYSGELRPMKAYVTKLVQIKGSIEDLLRLRKFF